MPGTSERIDRAILNYCAEGLTLVSRAKMEPALAHVGMSKKSHAQKPSREVARNPEGQKRSRAEERTIRLDASSVCSTIYRLCASNGIISVSATKENGTSHITANPNGPSRLLPSY